MSVIRVAASQFELRREPDVADILAHYHSLISAAAVDGANLIVFPELAATGLLGAITDHEVTTRTLESDYWDVLPRFTADIVEGLAALAQKYQIDVLGGSLLRIDDLGKLRNTAYFLAHDGEVATQDKIHLTPQEHTLGISGGDTVTLFSVRGHQAGMLICADIQFPELSRYLSAKGAEMILCPSLTWNSRGVHRVRTGCQARAIENQLFVVMSPLVGHSGLPEDGPMYAVGQALVAGPVDKTFGINDGLLAISESRTDEMLLFSDLDFDLLAQSRKNPEAPGLLLQRPDVYATLRADEG